MQLKVTRRLEVLVCDFSHPTFPRNDGGESELLL